MTREQQMYFDQCVDFLARMEGTTGKEMEDLYARMVGAQQ